MNALEVKSMSSPDVEIDEWEVQDANIVFFLLELEIGEARDARSDVFQVLIATPEGLRRNDVAEVITNRSTVVFSTFSWFRLRQEIRSIVDSCSAESWKESVMKLQRYFRWEYEDYVRENYE